MGEQWASEQENLRYAENVPQDKKCQIGNVLHDGQNLRQAFLISETTKDVTKIASQQGYSVKGVTLRKQLSTVHNRIQFVLKP